jgi:hypothetical protein
MLRRRFFARLFHVKVKTRKKMLSHANIEQGGVNVLCTKKRPQKFNMDQKLANPTLTWNNFRYFDIFLKFLKVKIGPAIINIDPVMEKPFFPAMFHVKNCGALEGHLRM